MNYCSLPIAIIISVFASCQVQGQAIKYLDNQPGKIEARKGQAIKGFNTGGIISVVNKIPIITEPVGYNVVENEAGFLNGNKPITGRVGIGMAKLYLFKGKQERQQEYAQVGFVINRTQQLTRESHFLPDDARRANLPEMFSDTVEFRMEVRNGQQVWVAVNQPDYEHQLIVINPKNKRCFIPVTKEQLAKLWISKLSADIDKYRRLIEDDKKYLSEQKGKAGNAQLVSNLENGIKQDNLWLDYFIEKKKMYETKLAGLSPAARKEPAEAGLPSKLAVAVSKGVVTGKITGDMQEEWVDVMSGVNKKHGIYTFNPDFFDPKLPRTAIQLIIIEDAFKIGDRFDRDLKMKKLLQDKFYPELDYKELAALMYK